MVNNLINNLVKTCSRCNEVLPVSDFYRDRNTITGHMYHCKECDKGVKDGFRAAARMDKWHYKGGGDPTRDPKYLKDRQKLFDEHGGGWWWNLDIRTFSAVTNRQYRDTSGTVSTWHKR